MPLLKNLIKSIPPVQRVLAERNDLRVERDRLLKEHGQMLEELHYLRSLSKVQRELEIDELRGTVERLSAEMKFWKGEAARYKTYYAPGHFYSPVPSLEQLRSREATVFERRRAILPGIDLNVDGQLALLQNLKAYSSNVPFDEQPAGRTRFHFDNPNFGWADALLFYCMIRHLKPKRFVEIGSGYSSCVALDTNELYFDGSIECTFIEPFPQLFESLLRSGDFSKFTIVQDYLQEVPLATFASLEAGDILFIDSSHVAKTDSDLNHILFYVLPLLQSGVHVHFHDVFYPFEYPKEWIMEGRAWNECYVLHALLSHNHDFEIELFSNYLTNEHREFVAQHMPLCLRNEGGSLWLKKLGERTLPLSLISSVDRHRLTPPDFRKTPASTNRLDVIHLLHPRQLGLGWYEYDKELNRRWMSDHAQVRLAGPGRSGQRLWLAAFQPNPEGVTVAVSANDHELGTRHFSQCMEFEESFNLPDALVSQKEITITIRLDKTMSVPGDLRRLGLSFGEIYIE